MNLFSYIQDKRSTFFRQTTSPLQQERWSVSTELVTSISLIDPAVFTEGAPNHRFRTRILIQQSRRSFYSLTTVKLQDSVRSLFSV